MKKNISIPSIILFLILLAAFSPFSQSSLSPQEKMKAEEFRFEVGATFGDRDVFEISVKQEGTITIEASWTGDALHLALILNGPTRSEFARKDGSSPLKVSHDVTAEILTNGTNWKVSIVNFSRRGSARGTIKVTYPEEKKIAPLIKFKPKKPPFKPKAKMIIVPNVVGMLLEEAKKSLKEKGFETRVKEITQFDPRYKGKEGQMIGQTQKAGSKLLPGSIIEIIYYNPKIRPKITPPIVKIPKRIPSGMAMKPDLMVESVSLESLDREGELPKVWIRIKNASKAKVDEAFKFRVELDALEDVFEKKEPMQSGESTSWGIYVHALKPGENQFHISLDIEENIDESNEDNNDATFTVTWNPPEVTTRMADLSIEGFEIQGALLEGHLAEGHYQTIKIRVRNSGDTMPQTINPDISPDSIRTTLHYKRIGEVDWQLFEEPRRGFINIEPGETFGFTFSREGFVSLPAGDYLFRGIVDEWADLKDRNFANNIMMAEISIVPFLEVRSFSPSRTAWGAGIILEVSTAKDLHDSSNPPIVRFNELEGEVVNIIQRSYKDYELIVSVPEGATSGPVSVTTQEVTGISQNSITVFGQPTITEITPQACPVGSTITIRGTNFVPPREGEGTVVEFTSPGGGRIAVNIFSRPINETEINVQVPDNAISGPLTVKTVVAHKVFSITSETPLRILPRISSIYPHRRGYYVGDQIRIQGTSFGPAPRVEFNEIQAVVLSSRGLLIGELAVTELEVRVPEDAATGKIRVITDEGSAESDFRVLTGPTINSISPQSGPEGTIVTIEGEDLDLITEQVQSPGLLRIYGHVFDLEIVGTPDRNLAQLRIPTGINLPGNAKIYVRFGNHNSNELSFELTAEGMTLKTPQIESFQPSRNIPGARVVVTVKNLPLASMSSAVHDGAVTVAFNGVTGEIEFIEYRREEDVHDVYARIPEGATTGPITVTVFNVIGTSNSNILIFGPPTITEISPLRGSPGQYITIRGTNFVEGQTVVYFKTSGGGYQRVAATITVFGESELQVIVPTNALTGPLTINTVIAGHMYWTTSEMVFIVER